jgi:hypothetical protein
MGSLTPNEVSTPTSELTLMELYDISSLIIKKAIITPTTIVTVLREGVREEEGEGKEWIESWKRSETGIIIEEEKDNLHHQKKP